MANEQRSNQDHHIDAVLEPITPGSRYDFVDINQQPILFEWPLARVKISLFRWCSQGVALTRRCLPVLIPLLTVLILAEIGLRMYEPRLLNRVYNSVVTAGHPLDRNEQGTRGPVVTIANPEGTTRILALGDSVTMGTGVAASETWPALLEGRLLTDGEVFEVMNTGLPALDIAQINLEISTRWSNFDPDGAVLVITGNMISFALARADHDVIEPPTTRARAATPASIPLSMKSRLSSVYHNLAIPNALILASEHLKYAIGLEDHRYNPDFPVGVMLPHGYTQDGAPPNRADQAYGLITDQLAQIRDHTDKLGMWLLVVYAPPRFSLDDTLASNSKFVDRDRLTIDPSKRLRSICEKLDIPFVDPSDAIRNAPPPTYVLSDYTHFSPSGHKALADVIANQISLTRSKSE